MTESRALESEGRADRIRYRGVQVGASTALLLAFSIGSAVQANLLALSGEPLPIDTTVQVVERLIANLAASAIIVGGLLAFPTMSLPWLAKIGLLALIELAGATTRGALHLLLGVHSLDRLDLILLDAPAPGITAAISLATGLVMAEVDHRLRRQERVTAAQSIRAANALQRLHAEELRVRREVAEGLHGTVQQHLVLIEAQLRALRERLGADSPPTPDDLAIVDGLRSDIRLMRERDVRGYSQILYPSGVGMGLAPAIRSLLRRLPSSIAVTLHMDDSVLRADDPVLSPVPVPLRILAIRVLEEGVTNALRHGHAGTLVVEVSVDDSGVLHLMLDDDGSGDLPADEREWSGLTGLRERLATRSGALALSRGPLGGARLTASLDLRSKADELP